MKQFHDWYFVRSSHSWFTIYSDSVSAIQSVCNSYSTDPLVKQIHLWLTLLKKKHKRVTFCWELELLAMKQLIEQQEWPMTLSTIRHCPIGITSHTTSDASWMDGKVIGTWHITRISCGA